MKEIRTLFLDDDPTRIREFIDTWSAKYAKELEVTHSITICEDAEGCIEALQESITEGTFFDKIFLDHDLNGEVYVPTYRKDTGSEVARWLSDNREIYLHRDIEIYIHSLNEPAAKYMMSVISGFDIHTSGKLHYIPFGEELLSKV